MQIIVIVGVEKEKLTPETKQKAYDIMTTLSGGCWTMCQCKGEHKLWILE